MNKISLLGETKERILNELRGGKRKTAKELADIVGIQVSAARKHLDALSELEIVKEEFIQDGVGRPKKFYLLSESGYEIFPRQYEKILCSMLERLEGTGRAVVEPMMKAIAQDIAKEMRLDEVEATNGDKGPKLEALVKALNEFGFDTSLLEGKNFFAITSHNCPLYKAAMKHQSSICHGLHDEIIKNALETREVRLEACISRGDFECRHVIDSKALNVTKL